MAPPTREQALNKALRGRLDYWLRVWCSQGKTAELIAQELRIRTQESVSTTTVRSMLSDRGLHREDPE